MSFSIRTEDESGSRTKKLIIALLILLSLFLVGTVVVLSSVSFYLALPTAAFLDEKEVRWTPTDAIRQLKYDPSHTTKSKRDFEVVSGEEEVEPALPEEDVWDIDGQGSGGYWMKKDWDGRVEGTRDWTRLLNVTQRPGEKIPRLIHQTWKDDQLPPKWRKAWKECREGMPDYEYMLWTDEAAHEFIKTHYPHHLQMYESYKYPIMRADAIRYYVLHHFGGVYMDLDIGCRRRLDSLLQGDWDAILPVTKPVGVSNDLMFSAKGSPFMDHTVHALPAWNHDWLMNYPTVMFSTGPMFLSGQYAIYSAAHPVTQSYPRAEVRILPKSLYGKNAPAETVPHAFFSHFYGSSWHAEDANFVTFLGAWGKILMYLGVAVVVVGIIRLIYLKFTGSSKEYRLLSLLPTHTEEPSTDTSFIPPGLEALAQNQLPTDIASALRRAGNLILAAPAVLLSGDRRNRRRHGLLYFVPALFQPSAPPRRGRTASEASQIPMRRSRRDRERERERLTEHPIQLPEQDVDQELESDATAPPPYDPADRSICSSPERMEKKLDFDEDDGYVRSDSSTSEYEQSSEWDWKDAR